jgi:hypothetical protein
MIRRLIHVRKNNVNEKDVVELKILREEFVWKKKKEVFKEF